jgi:hypothetical protein
MGSRRGPGRLPSAIVDQRKASQPDLSTSADEAAGATSSLDKATSSRDRATSSRDRATSSRDKATSSHDGAIPIRDKATSIQDGDRPEPAMPPLRIDRGRAQRLRADAQRPLSENLAEGIALSHVLLRYARETPQW